MGGNGGANRVKGALMDDFPRLEPLKCSPGSAASRNNSQRLKHLQHVRRDSETGYKAYYRMLIRLLYELIDWYSRSLYIYFSQEFSRNSSQFLFRIYLMHQEGYKVT